VNTIHCGSPSDGIAGGWKDGAALAEGRWMNIDQDRCVVAIAAPQDKEIARLSIDLNVTYIPYGAVGAVSCARQSAQDAVASANAVGGSDVQRAVAKASDNYRNGSWDLCDATTQGHVKLEDVPDKDLPAELRSMSLQQRQQLVDAKLKQRAEIQQKINALNAQREEFVAQKQREQAAGPDTLDSAVLKTVREEMKAKGFEVR
jgi:hypothetical protein